MALRMFEFVGGSSNKFWEINYSQQSLIVYIRFGRRGTNGQTQSKTFPSGIAAINYAERMMREKRDKGYVEVNSVTARVLPSAPLPKPRQPQVVAKEAINSFMKNLPGPRKTVLRKAKSKKGSKPSATPESSISQTPPKRRVVI